MFLKLKGLPTEREAFWNSIRKELAVALEERVEDLAVLSVMGERVNKGHIRYDAIQWVSENGGAKYKYDIIIIRADVDDNYKYTGDATIEVLGADAY